MAVDVKNENALKVCHLAVNLAHGYFTYLAVMTMAKDERTDSLIQVIEEGEPTEGYIHNSKTGDSHSFLFEHYYLETRNNEFVKDNLEKVWFTGALLTLGDALAKYDYFDRNPVLEFIRHLRNGIAHGNKFKIDKPDNLKKFPAHNRNAINKSTANYEITPELQNQPVLFDFIEPCDLVILLNSVGFHLQTIHNNQELFNYKNNPS